MIEPRLRLPAPPACGKEGVTVGAEDRKDENGACENQNPDNLAAAQQRGRRWTRVSHRLLYSSPGVML